MLNAKKVFLIELEQKYMVKVTLHNLYFALRNNFSLSIAHTHPNVLSGPPMQHRRGHLGSHPNWI